MYDISKINKEELELVNKITALAITVNYRTDFCVFLNFSGHVDSLEVQIKKSKNNYRHEIASSKNSITHNQWGDSLLEKLTHTYETLKLFLIDNDVPWNMISEVERIEYDYKF